MSRAASPAGAAVSLSAASSSSSLAADSFYTPGRPIDLLKHILLLTLVVGGSLLAIHFLLLAPDCLGSSRKKGPTRQKENKSRPKRIRVAASGAAGEKASRHAEEDEREDSASSSSEEDEGGEIEMDLLDESLLGQDMDEVRFLQRLQRYREAAAQVTADARGAGA